MRRALRISSVVLLAAIGFAPSALAQTDMIISEYIEGSSNNKVIELYNPTGSPIDLAAGQYKLLLYFNGSAVSGGTINLTAVIASGGRWVVAHTSAAPGVLGLTNQATATLQHNGDDAIVLAKGAGNTIVDAFGQVGVDPGTEWGTGLQSTADNTLRRKPLVCNGDLNQSDAFDPSIEWDGFATDTFDGIGQHGIGCGPTPARPDTWGTVKIRYR